MLLFLLLEWNALAILKNDEKEDDLPWRNNSEMSNTTFVCDVLFSKDSSLKLKMLAGTHILFISW